MTEPLDTLIHYRLERAQEASMRPVLADAGRWNTCVNRLYYSCFYAVSALLVRDGSPRPGILGCVAFSIAIMCTGKAELARVYNDLFERRQEGDYADFVRFRPTRSVPGLPKLRRLSPI